MNPSLPQPRQRLRPEIAASAPRPKPPRAAAAQRRPRALVSLKPRLRGGRWVGLRPSKAPWLGPRCALLRHAPKPEAQRVKPLRFLLQAVEAAFEGEDREAVLDSAQALSDAAKAAEDLYFFGEALRHFARIYLEIDRLKESERLIKEATEIAVARGEPEALARALSLHAALELNRARPSQAIGHLERALTTLGDGFAPAHSASIYQQLSHVALEEGDLDQAEAYLMRARALSEDAEVYLRLVQIASRRGDAEALERWMLKRIDFLQAQHGGDIASPGYLHLGALLIDADAASRAKHYLLKAEARAQQRGTPYFQAKITAELGLCAHRLEDFEEARARFEVALEFEGWSPAQRIALLIDRAYAEASARELDLARASFLEALERCAWLTHSDGLQIKVYVGLIQCEDIAGRVEKINHWHRQAMDALVALELREEEEEALNARLSLRQIYRARAEARLGQGQLSLAEAHLKRAGWLASRALPLAEVAELTLTQAALSEARGDLKEAKALLQRALRSLRQVSGAWVRPLRARIKLRLSDVEARARASDGFDVKKEVRQKVKSSIKTLDDAPRWSQRSNKPAEPALAWRRRKRRRGSADQAEAPTSVLENRPSLVALILLIASASLAALYLYLLFTS